MSQNSAELAAGVAKFKLSAGAEKEDFLMEVDAQQGSEVKSCPHEKVGRGTEVVEEVADIEADGDDKMEDIMATLKQEISAVKNAIWKQEIFLEAKHAYLQSLERQLAAIETEKATKLADLEEQSEENIFSLDPVKMALEIPLILEIILRKLDFASLMSSRSLSKYWNEAVVTVFSKTRPRILNLEKLFASSDFNPFPELEPKLTKRIYFREDCMCENPDCTDSDCDPTLKQKLIMFCEKFSAQIEEMDFDMSPSFAPTFLRAITNKCPYLKYFGLECYDYCASNLEALEADLIEMEAMPHEELFRMNLTAIEFINECDHQPKSFYEPMQRIISRAPNLTMLKIVANFYPNLTNNKNLKYLYFYGQVNQPNFSHSNFLEMLCQVKDSLEILEIKTKNFEEPNFQSFSFPVMKVLAKLKIWDVFLYPLEQDGKSFIQNIASQFPNLEHLEMSSFGGKGVVMVLKRAINGPGMQLFKIQSLVLAGVQDPSVLAFFSSWFPNLKQLTLSMTENDEIEPVFSALRGLKLKYFSFGMGFTFLFSDLVKALNANEQLFKGLDILEISAHQRAVPHMMDDLQTVSLIKNGELKKTGTVFCEWLQSLVKNMKSFTLLNFNFSGVSALEVISVIREHQLPVHFQNYF